MDSFVGIIVLFIIVGLIEKFSSKAKVNRNAGAASGSKPAPAQRPRSFFEEADGQQTSAPVAPASPVAVERPAVPAQQTSVHPAPGVVSEELLRKLEAAGAIARSAAAKAEPKSAKSAPELTEIERSLKQAAGAKAEKAVEALQSGESVADENGCLGGSLGAHTEEGETHAEHSAHEDRRKEAIAAEHAAALHAAALRNTDMAGLRRAVVMAEILDKPVSLRRRA